MYNESDDEDPFAVQMDLAKLQPVITALIELTTLNETSPEEREAVLYEKLIRAPALYETLDWKWEPILAEMYHNERNRPLIQDLLRVIKKYLLNADKDFAKSRSISEERLESIFKDAPPLIRQLHTNITFPDYRRSKSILYYSIKAGDIRTTRYILICQGLIPYI